MDGGEVTGYFKELSYNKCLYFGTKYRLKVNNIFVALNLDALWAQKYADKILI